MIIVYNDVFDAIRTGLSGDFIHSDPKSILKNLTPTIARKTVPPYDHSIWDLLYHTVIWNDIFLSNIKGSIANWNPENNWPSEEDKASDQNFYDLLKRFDENVEEVHSLLQSDKIDFSKKQKISTTNIAELTVIKLFITILQHISYHIGQIACVRKIVDEWPPSG